MGSGELALAEAMTNMEHSNIKTQVVAGFNLTSTGFGYIDLLAHCSKTLENDQLECSNAMELAAVGSKKEGIKVAEYHSKYQIASTKMNQKVGQQNGLLNKEEIMEHLQSHDLISVYATMEYVASIFLTTTSDISGFINR